MTLRPLAFWYAHDQGGEHLATTPEEIDAALDRVDNLAQDYGTVATVVRRGDEGPVLYVGLHGEVGALYYTHTNQGDHSRGNTVDTSTPTESSVSHRDAGAQLIYDWQQNEFLFPPNAEVPVADVRAAVHEFARSGTRPAGIQWQEWEPPIGPGGTFLADDDPAWG